MRAIVSFFEFLSRTDLESSNHFPITGQDLFIELKHLGFLKEGFFLGASLIGMEVRSQDNSCIGCVCDFDFNGVYGVLDIGTELCLPFISSFIEKVDIEANIIYVNSPQIL